MKTICILATSLLVSLLTKAQSTPSIPENIMPPGSTSNLLSSSSQPQAKYLGQNALGKIYAMPQDNMPCLVPNIGQENSMPVYITPLTGTNMPNATPKQHPFKSHFNGSNFLHLKKYAPQAGSKNLMLDLIRRK